MVLHKRVGLIGYYHNQEPQMAADRITSIIMNQYLIDLLIVDKPQGLFKYVATFTNKKTQETKRKFIYSRESKLNALEELCKQVRTDDILEHNLNTF